MSYTHTNPKKSAAVRNGSKLRQNNVEPGSHDIAVVALVDISWSKKEAIAGESIEAMIEVMGIKDGKKVVFSIFERSGYAPDVPLDTITAKLQGGKAKILWTFPLSKVKKSAGAGMYRPLVYFKGELDEVYAESNLIPLCASLAIKVENENGTPVSGEPVVVKLTDGKVVKVSTDGSGIATVKNVPPALQIVSFPDTPHTEPIEVTCTGPFIPVATKTARPQGVKPNVFRQITTYYYCMHKNDGVRRCVANTAVFEVVPDYKGSDAYKDEVVILTSTKRTLTAEGKELEKMPVEVGYNAYKLKCQQTSDGLVPDFWKADFWKGLVTPKEYVVAGLPRSLTVKCYRPDLFKLQIQFPPVRETEIGAKYEGRTADVVKDIVRGERPNLKREPIYEKKAWNIGGKWPMPVSIEAPISIFRNDQELKLSFLKSVGAIIDLAQKVNDIVEQVTDSLPKAGWYCKRALKLFQGTFVIEWGWKEYTDHRAYYYFGLNLDFKLIELKLEIGIGIDIGKFVTIQAYASIAGSVTISIKGARISPDGDAELSLPFGAEIVGNLGARCKATCFVALEGLVETCIKFDDGALKVSAKDGVGIGCTLKWTGLSIKATASVKAGKKSGDKELDEKGGAGVQRELCGPVDLGKWQWPAPDYEYKPSIMPRPDFHKLFIKILTKDTNIRVKTGEGIIFNDYMATNDLATHIEDYIHVRKDLRFDAKTAEALALEIRAYLEMLMMMNPEVSGFYHMTNDRFRKFIERGELKTILNRYVDPLKVIITKNR